MSTFEKDFKSVATYFPKLTYRTASNCTFYQIEGKIDIQDSTGAYWETFDIIIKVPKSYPYCIPKVFEKSNIIKRHQDWHIDSEGECCVDIANRLNVEAKRGINILNFIRKKVYSYFANQLYKQKSDEYANGEYKHSIEGVIQYYLEDLGISSIEVTLKILNNLSLGTKLERNEPCFCGSNKKLKKCHLDQINLIVSSGKETIEKNLILIKAYHHSSTNP